MDRLPVADEISDCRKCPLHASRVGVAVPSMPGADYLPGGIALMTDMVTDPADASTGTPFAGARAEVKMLDRLLEQAGIYRSEVLLMYRVRCSPQRGRITDFPEAVFNCDPWTVKELAAYDPSVVVLMGTSVLETVFGKEAKITKLRGQPRRTGPKFEWGSRVFVPTWHPYAASRTSRQQAQVVDDLRLARVLCESVGAYGDSTVENPQGTLPDSGSIPDASTN